MSFAAEDIAHWQSWIGRAEIREERLDVESLRRFAAALGEELDVERTPPSLMHWAFFLPVAPAAEIGQDGHPRRGGFLPPVSLPRRMFAAAEMRFPEPLQLDEMAIRSSTVADIRHKAGRTGDLILVEVDHRIEQRGIARVMERQTIVYREAGDPTPAVTPVPQQAGPDDVIWEPGPVDLFRFSAVTFNSHRIHYDLPYARDAEGYPDLVVHGPFTAARLYAYAARAGQPTAFAFRAVAPLFAGQPIRLTAGTGAGAVNAIRCDGATAMTATASH